MVATGAVVLILGAGANIGTALVKRFTGAGYRVAAVSRSAADPPGLTDEGVLSIKADLSQPSAPSHVFDVVKSNFNATPSVVIYNLAHQTSATDPTNLFTIGSDALQNDLTIMVTTPWAAATAATEAWAAHAASDGEKRSFIYTGNGMPKHVVPIVNLATVGVGKSASSYWVQLADITHSKKGWRFYYADERAPDGRGMGPVPGAQSHADFYLTLAEGKEDIPSYATFVEGKYKKF